MNLTADQLKSPLQRAEASLRQWIEAGEFPAGTALPSERKLAGRLDVSRTTVHTALENLEAAGLVLPPKGRTRTVAARDTQEARHALSATVAVLGQNHRFLVDPNHHSTGYSQYITIGVFDSLDRRRLHTLGLQTDRLAADGIGAFVNGAIRGVVVPYPQSLYAETMDIVESFRSAGVPISIYGDGLAADHLDRVISDHEQGAYLEAKWLLERGRRRILRYAAGATVADRPSWLAARDAGYLRALAEFGVEPIDALTAAPPSAHPASQAEFDDFVRLTAGYLLDPLRRHTDIDAIMVVSDGFVAPLAGALKCHGKAPNKDILLAGYDNYWEDSPLLQWECTAPVVTVDKGNETIGRELVEVVEERIALGHAPPPICHTVKPKLIIPGGT